MSKLNMSKPGKKALFFLQSSVKETGFLKQCVILPSTRALDTGTETNFRPVIEAITFTFTMLSYC